MAALHHEARALLAHSSAAHFLPPRSEEITMSFALTVNGMAFEIDAPQDTPLLWILREYVKLPGTRFGCGAGLCGACMVHIDGDRAFSCQTQLADAAGHSITTIEGLSADASHPVQKAWL